MARDDSRDEFQIPASRPIVRRSGRGTLFGWRGNILPLNWMLVVVLIGVAIGTILLAARGHTVLGRVVVRGERTVKGRPQQYARYVCSEHGQIWAGETSPLLGAEQGLREGDSLPIKVLRLGPIFLREAVPQLKRDVFAFPAMTGLCLLLMGVYGWYMHGIPLVRRWLVANGAPVPGQIVGKEIQRGKQVRHVVKYQFVTSDGRAIRAKLVVGEADWKDAVEGGSVTVLYHPGRPRLNVIYELADYEVKAAAAPSLETRDLIMTLREFQGFVLARADWFRGRRPETEESLTVAEQRLGVMLPESMKWLLRECGYWHATQMPSLDAAVSTTLEVRRSCELPSRYVVLEDRGDAGIVVLDMGALNPAGEASVYWIGQHDFHALCSGQRLSSDATTYAGFPEYVVQNFEAATDLVDEADKKYDPADYPEGRSGL